MALDTHDPALATVASHVPADPIDFQVFTYAVDAEPDKTATYANELLALIGKPDMRERLAALPRPIVPMVGSSTQRDLGRDRMRITALQDMTQCEDNLSIWLNHDYTLPESLYGSMQGKPDIHLSGEFADLTFKSDVEVLNERAAMVYLYSVRARKMGVSGGFMVLGVEWVDAKTEAPIKDEDVDIWDVIGGAVLMDITHVKMIEQSVVGIPANQRSWVEMGLKGYFARTHAPKLAPIVRSLWPLQYKDTLKSITDPALYQQLHDIAPRTQKTKAAIYFLPDGSLRVMENRHERAVTRKDVADLFAAPERTQQEIRAMATPVITDTSPAVVPADPPIDVTMSASEDDKAAQEKRAKACGIGIKDGGHVTCPGEYASFADKPSWWGDYTNFRYPLDTKAHADNAASRWGDASNRQQYSSQEQGIVSDNIKARQRHFGEDPDDDKGAQPEMTTDTLPDTAKALPAAADVDVASDGSHVKCTGTHSHSHPVGDDSQGGDKTHTHSHEHNGDNTHTGAAHAGGSHDKAAEPDVTLDVTLQRSVADALPTVAHRTTPSDPEQFKGVFPDRTMLIKVYSEMVTPLGLRVIEADTTPDATKCDWSDDEASAIRAGIAAVDAASDALMRIAGVPDDDSFGESDEGSTPMPLYGRMSANLQHIAAKMATYATISTKAGARHSAADQAHIQAIHDHACEAGATCPMASDDDTPSAGSMDSTDMQAARAGMATGKALETLEAIITAFKDAADQLSTSGVAALGMEVTALKKAMADLTTEKDALAEAFSRYGQTPFGRPTRTASTPPLVTRASDPAAVTAVLLGTPQDARAALMQQTRVTYVKGVGKVREWPDGVGAGNRPDLTSAQLDVLMYLPNGDAIREAYAAGRAASIPIVDDGD